MDICTKNLIKDIKNFKYSWQVSDCFRFAEYVRTFYGLKTFPNVSEFYTLVKEEDLTRGDGIDIFEKFLNAYASISEHPKNFDLVYMHFASVPCLGTLINDQVFYLSNNGGSYKNLSTLSRYIKSFYHYSNI